MSSGSWSLRVSGYVLLAALGGAGFLWGLRGRAALASQRAPVALAQYSSASW